MSGARPIDGRAVARAIRRTIKADIVRLADRDVRPSLHVIRVGDDPASKVYVGAKERAAGWVGIRSQVHHLDAAVSASDLSGLIDRLNSDDDVDGILLQLPLPDHLDPTGFLERISPAKDVDGFHPLNVGRMVSGESVLLPCTPRGIMALLVSTGVELRGAEAVVIGRSNIVGRPIAALLEHANCTVTICHSATRDVAAHVARADVLVVATGRAEMVRGEWIKPGAVVIDVGMSRRDDDSLVGDVHFESASTRAGFITPVPGGVGPMTVAMLLFQTAIAARARRGLEIAPLVAAAEAASVGQGTAS